MPRKPYHSWAYYMYTTINKPSQSLQSNKIKVMVTDSQYLSKMFAFNSFSRNNNIGILHVVR